MEIAYQKESVKSHVSFWQNQKKTIGFVPTMGALHAGHLSLVARAKAECDVVVVSIFVNPLQFNQASDFEKYPKNLEADIALLSNEDVDLIYAPLANEFYLEKPILTFDFGKLTSVLEGAMRPGHFSGVALVVSRLFHLVEPDFAYFGAKDLQQVAVIRRLILDLDFNLQLVCCPTSRDENGLALSSRNARLSPKGLLLAAQLFKALNIGLKSFKREEPNLSRDLALKYLRDYPEIELEYLEWVNADSMEPVSSFEGSAKIALCIAAWVEGVRLIDNVLTEDSGF
jgi:pantoate--beta-alanine ligase